MANLDFVTPVHKSTRYDRMALIYAPRGYKI